MTKEPGLPVVATEFSLTAIKANHALSQLGCEYFIVQCSVVGNLHLLCVFSSISIIEVASAIKTTDGKFT